MPDAFSVLRHVLWKYPRAAAALLHGTADPQVITAELVRFAEKSTDTADFLDDIRYVVPLVLSGEDAVEMPPDLTTRFTGLVFEAWVPGGVGAGPDGARAWQELLLAIIWFSCFRAEQVETFPHAALGNAAMARGRSPLSAFLAMASWDYLVTQPLGPDPFAVLSHIAAAVAAGMPPMAREALSVKVRIEEPDRTELGLTADHWADFGDHIRYYIGLASPTSESFEEWRRVVQEHFVPVYERVLEAGGYERSPFVEVLSSAGHADPVDRVRALIAEGASGLSASYGTGLTALHAAAMKGWVETARLLIAAGAELDVRCRWGSTPLHRAVQSERAEMVELLLRSGAEVNVTNEGGRTPLDWAARPERAEAAALLRAYGGKTGQGPSDRCPACGDEQTEGG